MFYEVLVRAFLRRNADGSGDLRGLIERIDYLQWLGIDCIWLPPFYDSPLRDGGYDIRDFYKVLPEFGTVDDFVALLDAAHRRGIRVITDLVMNHTSESHPWFQESRRDPDGPYGDFYVWSDTSERYTDARVIFVDTEESNWTFDPVRRQFYWHRFFSHQPDLNYDNPAVQEAMIDVLRFWLDLGIDGFRLDAVPYLFEREGTNCENLPETHAFLKRFRKVVDDEFPGRVLLAEANQWPADVVEYFGDPDTGGDECHMAFHFPLMPRIFMAVRRESRFPISEILAPDAGDPGHGAVGHLPAQPRRVDARDGHRRRARLHVLRIRQGPADEGQRRHPPTAGSAAGERPQPDRSCSPRCCCRCRAHRCLYYGDEIGMGDVIWLGDRDGVRTPMQWTPDRNARLLHGQPGPAVPAAQPGPVYGYQSVNVEAQRDTSTSLLNWTRTMLAVRRRHDAFADRDVRGAGRLEPVGARLRARRPTMTW